MSTSVFESAHFQCIQNYRPGEQHCAEVEDREKTERTQRKIEQVIASVLAETAEGITDEQAEAYETFLSSVEVIDGEFAALDYGNPFSDSISQLSTRLQAYKAAKETTRVKKMISHIRGFDFSRAYTPEAISRAETNITTFVKEMKENHIPSFSRDQIRQTRELAHQIRGIGAHFESRSIVQAATYLEYHALIAHPTFRAFLAGKTVNLESEEHARQIADRVNQLMEPYPRYYRENGLRITRHGAEILLERLYTIDEQIIQAGVHDRESPLEASIRPLEVFLEKAPRKRPLPSKFASIRARFEQASSEDLQPIRRPSPLIRRELTPEVFAERIASRLEALNPEDGYEIFQLIGDLKRHRTLFGEGDQAGINALIAGLQALRHPTAFKPSLAENVLMHRWMRSLGTYGITQETYERTINPVQREIKEELLRLIKRDRDSFRRLETGVGDFLKIAEIRATERRIEGAIVLDRQTTPPSPDLPLNMALTIQNFKEFKEEALAFLDQKWAGVLSKYSPKTRAVIEQLGYCNLAQQRDRIERSLVHKFLKGFASPELLEYAQTKRTDAYHEHITGLIPAVKKLYQSELKKEYLGVRPYLQWIEAHSAAIEVAYDQGSDLNRNMHSGTCLQNSQDRYITLLKAPDTPSDQLPMGSSQAGRFNRSVLNQLAEVRQSDSRAAVRMIAEMYDRIGLKPAGHHYFKGPRRYEALFDQVAVEVSRGQTQFIIGIDGAESGHAVNLQVHDGIMMYRFGDDNIGAVRFEDFPSLRHAFISWVETVYPDLNQGCSLEWYTAAHSTGRGSSAAKVNTHAS